MVLIVTNSHDPTADFLLANFREHGQPYFRFDTDKFVASHRITYSFTSKTNSFSLANKDTHEEVASSEISGVWYRRPADPVVEIDDANEDLRLQVAQEARYQYEWILRSLEGAAWVSKPERLRFAEDRLVQLRAARDVGFSIPETIITNSQKEASQFIGSHQRVCHKPLLMGQLEIGGQLFLYHTTLVSDQDQDFLSKVGNFPVLLQEYLEKEEELRITVVGDRIFPVRVLPNEYTDAAIDWRIENSSLAEFRSTSVKPHLVDMTKTLMRKLDLQFASMDVVVSKKGHYHFLDLNPNGQWAWLDQTLQLGIADELRHILSIGGEYATARK